MNKLLSIALFVMLITSGCKNKRHHVVSAIKSSAKLASTETVIDKLVIGSKERMLVGLVKVSQSEFVAYTEATILTGVDLDLLKPNDIKIKGRSIEIKLPHIQVLDFQYPFTKFRIDPNLTDNKLLSRISVVEQENLFRSAEKDIRENLQLTGVVKTTEANMRTLLTGLLQNLGFEEIYITFDKGELIPQLNLTGTAE